MAFTKEEKEILEYARKNGKTPVEAKEALSAYRAERGIAPVQTETVQAETQPTFAEDTADDFQNIGRNAVEQFDKVGKNILDIAGDKDRNVAEKAVGIGGEAFKRGGQFIGGSLFNGLKMLVPQGVEDKVSGAVEKIGADVVERNRTYSEENPNDRGVVAVKGLIERYENDEAFRKNVDAAGGFAEGLFEIVGGGAALKGARKSVEAGTESMRELVPARILPENIKSPYFDANETAIARGISNMKVAATDRAASLGDKAIDAAVVGGQKAAQTYRDLVEGSTRRITDNLDRKALTENSNLELRKVETNLGDMYVNAVSPGVKGKKKTVDGIIANKQAAVRSVENIVNNKNELTFRDIETNEMVTGELPTNLWEFGGAVTHQKSQVYKQVLENIGKAADEPIDTTRIVEAMAEIKENPVYANESAIINRADQALQKYFTNDYTPREIEDLIQLENDRLQAFYRGSGTQADAIVSAIVANNLRDMLDEAVDSAGGESVKALKQQYGALKSIEGDVIHRALHNSQAREAGLVDMFGIRTIGDVAMGAAGDLGALQRGAGQIAGEGFIKALNDRDALINRMFMVAEQAYTPPK